MDPLISTLIAPEKFLPTISSLCGIPFAGSVEGHDLLAAWRGEANAFEQDALLTMNISEDFCYLEGDRGIPIWRGVRTKQYSYVRFIDGECMLFDIIKDPLQMTNLAASPAHKTLRDELDARMRELMARLHEDFLPPSAYTNWFDEWRRIVPNTQGDLGNPNAEPDWSLLESSAK